MTTKSTFPGFNTILMGPPGTGKTYALTTLADAGIETFVIFLENGLESLVGAYADRGKPIPPNLHWCNLPTLHRDFAAMRDMAQKIGKFDLKFLASHKDVHRGDHNRFEALYSTLNNFVDQHGESFGDVGSWGNDRVLCLDSLTGLSNAALEMMTGDKPVRDRPDYGIAQHQVQTVLGKLAEGCACHFVLTAHVEREVDEILGGVKLMPVTPGKALKGVISIPFSDVILTKREGDKFYWDTADSSADLKTRNLPIASKLPPDFAQVIAKWAKRRDAAGGGA